MQDGVTDQVTSERSPEHQEFVVRPIAPGSSIRLPIARDRLVKKPAKFTQSHPGMQTGYSRTLTLKHFVYNHLA
ncbi:MAG: hypothetical protein U5K76_14605 [Woeseiaceae bacterium]|nr:hypothetical protein [Woeseiaceae bacterium]